MTNQLIHGLHEIGINAFERDAFVQQQTALLDQKLPIGTHLERIDKIIDNLCDTMLAILVPGLLVSIAIAILQLLPATVIWPIYTAAIVLFVVIQIVIAYSPLYDLAFVPKNRNQYLYQAILATLLIASGLYLAANTHQTVVLVAALSLFGLAVTFFILMVVRWKFFKMRRYFLGVGTGGEPHGFIAPLCAEQTARRAQARFPQAKVGLYHCSNVINPPGNPFEDLVSVKLYWYEMCAGQQVVCFAPWFEDTVARH